MSQRRVPLADNPNAANSPLRSKRTYAALEDGRENDASFKKRLLVDGSAHTSRVPLISASVESKVFVDRQVTQATGYAVVRKTHDSNRAVRHDLTVEDDSVRLRANQETVRAWRKHYLRVFPTLVFYFESAPQEVCLRSSRQIAQLGAREEKFFSKSITHIVTTRSVPTQAPETGESGRDEYAQNRTINPLLLDKPSTGGQGSRYSRVQTLETNDLRRQQASRNDVLVKARDMGIKIWTFEKFQRVMSTLLNPESSTDDTEDIERAQPRRAMPRSGKEADLSQLLAREKINATVERQPWQGITPFQDLYIYVHDMDERVRPIMMREFAKPQHKEDGDWPMLRSAAPGRCPFVEDPSYVRREQQAKKTSLATTAARAEEARAANLRIDPPRTRSQTRSPQRAPLQETNANDRTGMKMPAPSMEKPSLQRQPTGESQDSMPPVLGSAMSGLRGVKAAVGGEPVASGIRQNITSAVRSQMISSTAATAPAHRTGTTKQVHQLQRQVLERHQSGHLQANGTAQGNNDARTLTASNQRAMQRKDGAFCLAEIKEEGETTDKKQGMEERSTSAGSASTTKRKAKAKKPEPKPGYCEPCAQKYDDFSEHIMSKKHRRFALDASNWTELDELLQVLARR